MRSSYKKEDVTILLKDITNLIKPLDCYQREKLIQSGTHYSSLLPEEYIPTKEYFELYNKALNNYKAKTAQALVNMAHKIIKKRGNNIIIVSLARAGTPIGILLKRYLEYIFNKKFNHYTISIIRDIGIDKNALDYIINKHGESYIQFVDGWTGKGIIMNELNNFLKNYKNMNNQFQLAVLADPAGITKLYGTREDFLIPSSCLNAPVSGLFSRTVYNKDVISENDFHGSVYYENMKDIDVSYNFIDTIMNYILENDIKPKDDENILNDNNMNGWQETLKIASEFNISNINYIKPSIGETTRVLMRRVPWKILVKDINDKEKIGHILQLCKEKNVEVLEYNLVNYCVCGIIKKGV